jgi:hypothetical protein
MDKIIFRVVGFTGMADNSPTIIKKICEDIWNPNGEYNITSGNDYTHLIVFNMFNPKNFKITKDKIFGFQQEPSWSRKFDKSLTDKCETVFTHCPEVYTNPKRTTYDTTICVHNNWPKNKQNRISYNKNFNTNTIVNSDFKKTKKLSIAFSYYDVDSMGTGPGTLRDRCGPNCYKHRNDLIYKLFKSDIDFSLWGGRWDKALHKWKIKNDNRYKGWVVNKIDTIRDFEYHISIENDIKENQISEKLIDPIMCKTVPIYYGASNIGDYFDMSGIEIIDTYDEDCIEKIKKIINKPYSSYDRSVFEKNIKVYREETFNPFKKVLNYIKNK